MMLSALTASGCRIDIGSGSSWPWAMLDLACLAPLKKTNTHTHSDWKHQTRNTTTSLVLTQHLNTHTRLEAGRITRLITSLLSDTHSFPYMLHYNSSAP